jgi:hypothetical protein
MPKCAGSLTRLGRILSGWHFLVACMLAVIAFAGASGCAQQPSSPQGAVPAARAAGSPWTLPTSTMAWNEYACDLIARNQAGQFPAARTLSYLNLAISNAYAAAKQQGRRGDGAAAGAAATVLVYMFPKDEATINARLAGEIAAIGSDGRGSFSAGVDVGRATGADVVAMAKADRADLAWTGPLPEGPGKWSSRAQPPRPPLGPRLGEYRTFFIASGSDFRAPAPPAYDAPAFRAEVAEVRRVADARTNEQVRVAQYWETLSGSFNAGHWNEIARDAIAAHGLDEAASARVLAQMHMAGVDANVACHDSKYVYWVPRPTQMDPDIRLAIAVPNHPSYPSNHACISGAMGAVLDAWFPDDGGRYSKMAREAGESRIYGGIHYRMDIEQGFVIARKVSERAIAAGVPPDKPFSPAGK